MKNIYYYIIKGEIMAKVLFLDGGFGIPGNLSVMTMLEECPEQREQWIKEFEEENPKQWSQFKQLYPDFIEKLRKKDIR